MTLRLAVVGEAGVTIDRWVRHEVCQSSSCIALHWWRPVQVYSVLSRCAVCCPGVQCTVQVYSVVGTKTSRRHRSATKSRQPRPNESGSLVHHSRRHVDERGINSIDNNLRPINFTTFCFEKKSPFVFLHISTKWHNSFRQHSWRNAEFRYLNIIYLYIKHSL